MNNVARIQKQLESRGFDAVLITDEKNQRYAAGFPITDGAVLVSLGGAWLITDGRYIEAANAETDDCVNVVLYDDGHSLVSRIKEQLAANKVTRLAAEDKLLSHSEYSRYEKALGMELLGAGDMFEQLRAEKNEFEIQSIVEAQRISEKALEQVLHIIKPGMTEREVAAELVYYMLRYGSEGNSFAPIVVTGSKTSHPHGVPGDKVICAGDFLTMDFGSLKNGYCSDMTRTVAIGSATDEMKNVYDIVLRAQLAGIAVAKAGVLGKEIDGAGRRLIEKEGYGDCFGHGFGHCLGLEIHENPRANTSGNTPMPLNSVCSAEPGIYIPGRFGVRIEDMIVLRDGYAENLTKADKAFTIL